MFYILLATALLSAGYINASSPPSKLEPEFLLSRELERFDHGRAYQFIQIIEYLSVDPFYIDTWSIVYVTDFLNINISVQNLKISGMSGLIVNSLSFKENQIDFGLCLPSLSISVDAVFINAHLPLIGQASITGYGEIQFGALCIDGTICYDLSTNPINFTEVSVNVSLNTVKSNLVAFINNMNVSGLLNLLVGRLPQLTNYDIFDKIMSDILHNILKNSSY